MNSFQNFLIFSNFYFMEKNMKNVFSMSIHIDIIQLLEKHLDKEYQEHLDYAKDRNWQDA